VELPCVLYLHMEASQHTLVAACFTLHRINATLAIVPQRGAGLWIVLPLNLTYILILFCHCPERTCPIHTSAVRSSESQVHFLALRSIIQRNSPCPRLLMNFRKKFIFYGEVLLTPRPTPKLEDHPLSAVRDCLFNIIAATLHIWRPSPPSAT
jgi:hypothetical protein